MRVDPQLIVDDWEAVTQGSLIEIEPDYVRRAREQLAAEREIEGQHWFDATLEDVDRIIAAASQMELALPKMTQRSLARERFANYWRDVVAPHACSRKEATIHERMKLCRRAARVGLLPSGKMLLQWDEKAGLPLYDPDDAREEAMRLSRRVVPHLMELLKRPGYRAYYLCATAPNSPRGELAQGMRAMYRRWISIIRSCKRKSRPFPIVGAIAVMESPLGRFRDWHPHLNIIVVCDEWLDFKALKDRWHWNIEMRPLDGHQSTIERTFRELIKYSCRTVSEKSLAKSNGHDPEGSRDCSEQGRSDQGLRHGDAACADALSAAAVTGECAAVESSIGRAAGQAPGSQTGQAPAMEQWRAVESLEYSRAHEGFRRTRAYRELFGIPKPEPLDRTGVRWHGWQRWDGARWNIELLLLDSIPGDKSTPRESWKAAWQKLLGPPDHLARVCDARRTIEQHFGPVSRATS